MKTLDEVIKAYEICIGYSCSNAEHDVCPYFGESDMGCMKEPEKDALHYLKEYRETKKHLACLNDAEIRGDNTQVINNPPLTWDELKNMVGKPVWVEALLYKQWAVIAYIGEEYIRFEGANLYAPECRIYMGEDNGWQAYRKERTE